jgi:uncharacterized membrane protein YccF (DUF307 family)
LLWIAFGGLWMAAGWVMAGIFMAITIVGLPWTRAASSITSYALLPFGRSAVSRADYLGREDLGTGPLGTIGNLVWLVLAGWWLALGHLVTAIMLAITIIGTPFAWAHLKLAGIALADWKGDRGSRRRALRIRAPTLTHRSYSGESGIRLRPQGAARAWVS